MIKCDKEVYDKGGTDLNLLFFRLSSDDESEDEAEKKDDVRKALERLVDVAETNKVYDISKSFIDETDAASESESVESI